MKFVVVIVVVVGLLWLMLGRERRSGASPRGAPGAKATKGAAPVEMLACAHCGVHLPRTEALFDAAGRAFCVEAHRVAGPR